MVRLDPLQFQRIEVIGQISRRLRLIARHQARDLEAGHFISRHIADLPNDVVPLVIPQNYRSLALLSEKRGKLLGTVVVNAQFQRDDVNARTVWIDPKRESIELQPILPIELTPNTVTAPPAAILRSRDLKSGRHTQAEGLPSVA